MVKERFGVGDAAGKAESGNELGFGLELRTELGKSNEKKPRKRD